MQYRIYGYTLKGYELINNQLTEEKDMVKLVQLAKDNTNYMKIMVIKSTDNGDECLLLEDCNHSYREVQTDKKSKELLKKYRPRSK